MRINIKFLLVIIITLVLLSSGCSNELESPDGTVEPIRGLIYLIDNDTILIVSDIDNVNIPWNAWAEAGKRAVNFTLTGDTEIEMDGEIVERERLSRGQLVDVYHAGFLAESYPEQGGADKIIIVNDTFSGESITDSGRFIGVVVKGTGEMIEVKISGVPDELPGRLYRLTDEAWEVFNNLDLEVEEEILFWYVADSETEGLIYDLSRIMN
ncbi:MAG: DUF3221 domain-containing protein [Bacillota bacterium]|nr:DUF3221 domain-containing protein [Bacillota bacterium]